MSDKQVRLHFQVIRQQIEMLQREGEADLEAIDAALEDLYVIYEQMQTKLEMADVIEEGFLQQSQQLVERYNKYYDLFYASPIAYLVTDSNGLILDANQMIAQLLNVPQQYLVGKPLSLYVSEGDRLTFRRNLNWLPRSNGIQVWQMHLRPRKNFPFAAELHVDAVRSNSGLIKELRIGVYNISQSQQRVASSVQEQSLETIQAERTAPQLPQSLDGLRVLIVDDEADAREFISAVLESHGIGVRAVSSAAAALEELKRFHPDILVCDIRMPGGDGYNLIRQVRALEAKQGGHIPAAAITAYLEEDWAKALTAGFEAHLHKLAQPTELIELIAQLAGHERIAETED